MKDDVSDFATPGKNVRRFRISIPGLIWELFLATLVFGAPRAREIYADFGVDLYGPTVLVLRSSRRVITHAPALLVLLGAVWVVQDALSARGGTQVSRTRSVLMLACPVLLLLPTLIALGLPIFGITHRLRG